MKFKITAHYNKENGSLLGYSLAYKPFPFIPFLWKDLPLVDDRLYKDMQTVEHVICFVHAIAGGIKKATEYQ